MSDAVYSHLSGTIVTTDGFVHAELSVNGIRVSHCEALVRLSEDREHIHLTLPSELFQESA